MREDLHDLTWVSNIRGALGWQGRVVVHDTEDIHHWKFGASKLFSSRSAYRVFLAGSVGFEPWKRLWKSWAPSKCKTFIWVAIRNRCWTADCLQKRGLPHPDCCPLCDHEEETIQHLLTTCVFARQFWFNFLQPLNLSRLAPRHTANSFVDWWRKSWKKLQKHLRKEFNSLVILGFWIIWKHRNARVFDGNNTKLAGSSSNL